MAGYVYLIGTPVFRWYKVGKSKIPEVRVCDLGILLPFKIKVIGVWKAEDHDRLEAELHKKYEYCRINGEWFSFENGEIQRLFEVIPKSAQIFPGPDGTTLRSVFASFSNIQEDQRGGNKIIGVRVQKLRGDFTPAERDQRRIESMERKKQKKALAATVGQV